MNLNMVDQYKQVLKNGVKLLMKRKPDNSIQTLKLRMHMIDKALQNCKNDFQKVLINNVNIRNFSVSDGDMLLLIADLPLDHRVYKKDLKKYKVPKKENKNIDNR